MGTGLILNCGKWLGKKFTGVQTSRIENISALAVFGVVLTVGALIIGVIGSTISGLAGGNAGGQPAMNCKDRSGNVQVPELQKAKYRPADFPKPVAPQNKDGSMSLPAKINPWTDDYGIDKDPLSKNPTKDFQPTAHYRVAKDSSIKSIGHSVVVATDNDSFTTKTNIGGVDYLIFYKNVEHHIHKGQELDNGQDAGRVRDGKFGLSIVNSDGFYVKPSNFFSFNSDTNSSVDTPDGSTPIQPGTIPTCPDDESYGEGFNGDFKICGAQGKAGDILKFATRFNGMQYIYGAKPPIPGHEYAFDCSSLVQYAAKMNGVMLPRVATDQYRVLPKISAAEATVGDLFFCQSGGGIEHVGFIARHQGDKYGDFAAHNPKAGVGFGYMTSKTNLCWGKKTLFARFPTKHETDTDSDDSTTDQKCDLAAPNRAVGHGAPTTNGTGPGASVVGYAITPNAKPANEYQKLAYDLMPKYGMDQREFPYLQKLWVKESGWNPNALNKSSGAIGIPQCLPLAANPHRCDGLAGNARAQIEWGLNYLKRYNNSPRQALEFHKIHNWY